MAEITILNTEQHAAVNHGSGPLLIIAGAGSGKTTVVTERIKHLILQQNVSPSEILALTFTEKAAQEMEERVDIAMPYGYTEMWIATFHAFCDRVLRDDAIHIGLNSAYKLATETESLLFLRKHLFAFQLDYFRPLGNPYKFLMGMLQHFARLKDEDVSVNDYLLYAQVLQKNNDLEPEEKKKILELADAFKTYEDLKVKEGIIDFSDLIANTLLLFRTRKNVLSEYQTRFKYILVDEFQDTNYAQNQLAMLLVGNKQNITVVGDDDQSIYRFRGSSVSNIIQFREYYPDAKIITLTKNYRSTEEILHTSYKLIQHNNPDRLEVKEHINKKLTSERQIKGEKVSFLFADRVENEAEQVTKKILDIIETKKYQWKDIAILVRANDHAQSFIRSFERYKIPYQFLGPGHLFHQEEIKDLIAYLKVLYNFEDSAALYRILNIPIFHLASEEIAAILNFARRKNYTLFEAIEHVVKNDDETIPAYLQDKAKTTLNTILSLIKQHLARVSKNTAGQIVYYFLHDSGILETFLKAKTEQEVKRYQNIAKFFEKLKSFETEHENASVFTVVDWIDLSMQMGEGPLATDVDWTENNAVNILTIHSSKGLEFPVVFLVNLVTQRFPTRERREQIPISQNLIKEILPIGDYHLEEERRLFYVGMTRARDHLFLTAAHFYGEAKRERKVSPFVYEALGEKIVEKEQQSKKEKQIAIQPSLLDWSPMTTVPQKPSIAKPLRITYVSYSQLQTFSICPLHYKLKYLFKVPTAQTSSQSFGTSVHSTLRDFYQLVLRDKQATIQNALLFLEKNWINEGYKSKLHMQEAYEHAKQIIIRYLEKNYTVGTPTRVAVLEMPFQFTLTNGQNEILKVGGRIDRIDLVDGQKIEILDYKTGNTIPTEKSLYDDLQLHVYALAATMVNDKILNKKPEDIILSLYYLEEDKKLITTRTQEQLEQAKKQIFEKVHEIATSDFTCSRSFLCQDCEYKILCQG